MQYFNESFKKELPCKPNVFQCLLNMLEDGDALVTKPSLVLFHEIVKAAYSVGLDIHILLRSFGRFGVLYSRVDIVELLPESWKGMLAEKKWMKMDMMGDDILKDIPSKCYFKPVETARDERWLLPHIDNLNALSCESIVVDKTRLNLPLLVTYLLKMHPGRIVLAGEGIITNIVVPCKNVPCIYSLFIVCSSEEHANVILANCIKLLTHVLLDFRATQKSLVITTTLGITLQIDFRIYESISQVIVGQELCACRIGAWYSNDDIAIRASPSWLPCIQSMTVPIDYSMWSSMSVKRIFKLHFLGFHVILPGVARAAFSPYIYLPTMVHKNTILGLFAFETFIKSRRITQQDKTQPLSSGELESIFNLNATPLAPAFDLRKPIQWQSCLAGKSNYACFEDLDPELEELYTKN